MISLSPFVSNSIPQANQVTGLAAEGGQINNHALFGAIQAILNNSAPSTGTVNFQTSAAATLKVTNIAGMSLLLTGGAPVTLTFDNAPNILQATPGAYAGMLFPMEIGCIGATSMATPVVANTGITLAGTTAVAANSLRNYRGQFTQIDTTNVTPITLGTTFTSLVQIGATNMYTLNIVGNASPSAVGSLIYIGALAGTLPPGWYPCYNVSTTAIVVALPPNGTVAWTCTAANMVQPSAPKQAVLAPLILLGGIFQLTGTLAV